MLACRSSLVAGLLSLLQLSSAKDSKKDEAVYFPTYFPYGDYPRLMTDIHYGTPSPKNGIPTVVDQGSANYWVYQKGAIVNYGSQFLGELGPCNITVKPSYNFRASTTATKKVKHSATYAYGGNGKIVTSYHTVNDTMRIGDDKNLATFEDCRVGLANFTVIKQAANNCKGANKFQYDHGILGLSRYKNPTSKTVGPSFKQDLLDLGKISSSAMSMWMDSPPDKANGTFSGSVVFGGVATDKFKGPLVLVEPSPPKDGYVGYYVPAPSISTTSTDGKGKKTELKTGKTKRCLIDSGTGNDNLAISEKAFRKAAGLIQSGGYPAYNGSCDDLAKSKAALSFTFPGLNKGKSVTIDIPLSNYARGAGVNPGKKNSKCALSMELATGFDCVLAAPFNTALFFAVNDDKNEIALAQGGVSNGATKGAKGLGKIVQIGPHDSLRKAGAV